MLASLAKQRKYTQSPRRNEQNREEAKRKVARFKICFFSAAAFWLFVMVFNGRLCSAWVVLKVFSLSLLLLACLLSLSIMARLWRAISLGMCNTKTVNVHMFYVVWRGWGYWIIARCNIRFRCTDSAECRSLNVKMLSSLCCALLNFLSFNRDIYAKKGSAINSFVSHLSLQDTKDSRWNSTIRLY